MNDNITVLHLSDLHFPGAGDTDVEIVLRALRNDVQEQITKKGISFDLILFSGDLVNAGNSAEQYDQARSKFTEDMLAVTGLSESHVLFVPGNHDINRDVVRRDRYVELGLLQLLSNRDQINGFIGQHIDVDIGTDLPPPLTRVAQFYKSIWTRSSASRVVVNPFLSVHSVDISDKSVGIACFNTSWRCTGEPDNADYGHLILGERIVDKAVESLADSDLRFGVLHHPISWLHEADQASVESRLQSEFDLLFCGHIHRSSPERHVAPAGDVIISQGGCLYNSRDHFNGYSIVRIKPAAQEVDIIVQEYSDQRRKFIPADRILDAGIISFPFASRGARLHAILPGMLRKVRPNIRQLANDHLSLVGANRPSFDIETHFVCPNLSERSEAAAKVADDLLGPSDVNQIESALRDSRSLTVIGRSESGKTTLAHYFAVKISNGRGDTSRLPLLARFSELRRGDNSFWRLVRNYASEISDGTLNRAFVEREPLFVVVDDVDVFVQSRSDLLKELVASRTNVRWCLMARNPAGSISVEPMAEHQFPGFRAFTIRDLPRSAIRALSAKWLKADSGEDKTDELYRTVMEQIQRTGLPRSGYIVSLMLWTVQNKSKGELLNEAVLLQNIIDFMLGRMDYTGALRREFDFNSKTAVLQSLAYHFKMTEDAQPVNDVVRFVIELLQRKGLRYDAAEIVKGFIDCGILSKIADDVSFRYRRFQEFFVAGYLRDNKESMAKAVGAEWLEYCRELDLYTGRFRHEGELLEIGWEKLSSAQAPKPSLDRVGLSQYLESSSHPELSKTQLQRMRRERLSHEQIDGLLDKADRRVAEKQEQELEEARRTGQPTRSMQRIAYYVALEMYSQFLRNLEFVDRDAKALHLRRCLDAWELTLIHAFSIMKGAMNDVKEDVRTGPRHTGEGMSVEKRIHLMEVIEEVIKYLLPTIVAGLAYRSLGSEKLTDFIDEIAADSSVDELQRLICVFILLELDPARAIGRLGELADSGEFDRWTIGAVTQRLFAHYTSRPLSAELQARFEGLVAELELGLSGQSSRRDAKGKIVQQMKRRVFKEGKDDA
jgi:predicted MPP superfamily phosphohydrolase